MDQYDIHEPDFDVVTPPTEPQARSMNTKKSKLPSSLKKVPKYHQQKTYPSIDLSPPSNMDAFYPIIKNERDKASKNNTILHFSKGPLPQAKALQPPVLQAKKHPPNVKYPQYKEVPETDNIVQEDLELPTSCIGMRITMPFKDGFFPGTIIDEFTIVKDGERIQNGNANLKLEKSGCMV